MNWY
jgi:hypothetical protein